MQINPRQSIAITCCVVSLLGACSSKPQNTAIDAPPNQVSLDPLRFEPGALAKETTTVPCTLASGLETSCYSITIKGEPSNTEVGPFCPTSIDSTAEESGIWLDGSGEVYEADGAFIVNLPQLYDDDHWQLYDPATGKVKVTDTEVACRAAARPNVDENYQNHCVECSLDYLGGGVEQTFLIPVKPTSMSNPTPLNGAVGVALNGVVFDNAAPVHAILGAYTIAAFDDCGGHVNPFAGYHYHAATGCSESSTAEPDNHSPLIGYARDGYGIYAMTDAHGVEPEQLDECRGETDAVRGYHYHVAGAGENAFIGCYHGDAVEVEGHGPPGGRPPPDGKRPPPPEE